MWGLLKSYARVQGRHRLDRQKQHSNLSQSESSPITCILPLQHGRFMWFWLAESRCTYRFSFSPDIKRSKLQVEMKMACCRVAWSVYARRGYQDQPIRSNVDTSLRGDLFAVPRVRSLKMLAMYVWSSNSSISLLYILPSYRARSRDHDSISHTHTHTHTHTHARARARAHAEREGRHTLTMHVILLRCIFHLEATTEWFFKVGLTASCLNWARSTGKSHVSSIMFWSAHPFFSTNVLSHWNFSRGNFGSLSSGKASCGRAALSKLRCMLGVQFIYNPPNSDIDYKILKHAHVIFCMSYTRGTSVCSLTWRTLVGYIQSAQNFDFREARPLSPRKA